jgi:DNA (cytosine-5)-methyltransferase 1
LLSRDDITTIDLITSDFFVRRLTPLECERVQGFPDGWTEYGIDGRRISDNQRYRALGNSVAIPCVQFILSRMKD